jgi:DNA polymerase I
MPMVAEFERVGMRIDKSHLIKVHGQATADMETLAAKVRDLTGERDLNLGSPAQLSNLLFNVLRLKNPGREKWTKNRSRLAADADVLKAMLACKPTPTCSEPANVIRAILDWRERDKIRSTYTYSLIAKCDEDDRLHTDVSMTRTGTQRLASSDPNLQNIPIRTPLGREIRNAFIAARGNKIGSVDASQIEMRMNAVDAQCRNMLLCFWGQEDVYWQVAELTTHQEFAKAQRESEEKCCGPGNGYTYKKWYRQNAKVTALMVGYDASAGGLFDQFLSYGIPGWTEDLCAKAIIDYFAGYNELLVRRKEHHKRAFRFGRVWDMWGFTRPIPQVKSCYRGTVNEGLRQAGNLAGQGGAAGIIKLWMAVVWDEYVRYWRRHGIRMLMQVHDELVAEGPAQVLEDFFRYCAKVLRNLLPYDFFNCPLDANYGIADSWGVADH